MTDILRIIGLVDPTFYPERSRQLGTAMHLACQLLDEGDLDEGTLDPEIVEPVSLYRQFSAEVQPEILAIEEEVASPLGYVGRLDRRVRINGREGVLDIKGQPSPEHPLQLAGYALCFPRPLARWLLYLRNGRTYQLCERTLQERRRDDATWGACLTLAHWRRDHGV